MLLHYVMNVQLRKIDNRYIICGTICKKYQARQYDDDPLVITFDVCAS